MATSTLGFCDILSESKKIMKSHSRHFLALSVLFLLPLSFSLVAFPTIQLSITDSDSDQTKSLLRYSIMEQRIGVKTLCFYIFYPFTMVFLSLCATGTITYSVHQGFFGRPVKLVSAIKSLSNSLLPLFVTVLCAQIIISTISVGVGMVVFLVFRGIVFLGFQGPCSLNYFTIAYVIGLAVWGLGLIYLQVNWALACVIVVVESNWGLGPLRRSAYLVRGMRGVSVSLLLFFVGVMWIMVWGSWESGFGSGILGRSMFVVNTVVVSAFVMILLLHSVTANTVLYMYCKALHGELVEEFVREYVSLPFNEEKVPRLVSVIQP